MSIFKLQRKYWKKKSFKKIDLSIDSDITGQTDLDSIYQLNEFEKKK